MATPLLDDGDRAFLIQAGIVAAFVFVAIVLAGLAIGLSVRVYLWAAWG